MSNNLLQNFFLSLAAISSEQTRELGIEDVFLHNCVSQRFITLFNIIYNVLKRYFVTCLVIIDKKIITLKMLYECMRPIYVQPPGRGGVVGLGPGECVRREKDPHFIHKNAIFLLLHV